MKLSVYRLILERFINHIKNHRFLKYYYSHSIYLDLGSFLISEFVVIIPAEMGNIPPDKPIFKL